MSRPETLNPNVQLPDKGRFMPSPRLRFDFRLDRHPPEGYRLRGTLVDVGRQEMLGTTHEAADEHGLVIREPVALEEPATDTLESFWVDAATVAECIDGLVRKLARGRICSRDSQLVTTVPAMLRDAMIERWLVG